MATNDGIVISDTEPTVQGKVTWLKILPDGSREWYEPSDGGWSLIKSEPAPALANHSHPTHGNINFTGTISADGYAGINSRITLGNKKLTFKEGICILEEDV